MFAALSWIHAEETADERYEDGSARERVRNPERSVDQRSLAREGQGGSVSMNASYPFTSRRRWAESILISSRWARTLPLMKPQPCPSFPPYTTSEVIGAAMRTSPRLCVSNSRAGRQGCLPLLKTLCIALVTIRRVSCAAFLAFALPALQLVLPVLIASLTVHAAAAKRPNVLFLISDDLRPELGCYGVKGVKTPHLDAFARVSVRFDRAYVQYPLCNPSRTSVLTGRYPTSTGVLSNNEWVGSRHPDWLTLPAYFKRNGYTTLRAGKIFHGTFDDTAAWTEGGQPRPFGEGDRVGGSTQDPKKSDSIVVLNGDGEGHVDHTTASRTIAMLRQHAKETQPFLLACGFSKPHSAPTAPKKFFDLYDPASIPLPSDFAARPTTPAGFPERSVPPRNSDLFIGRDASEQEAREMKRAYWASVSYVDAQVGRVLAAIDELGLRENTVIVFWGDHGYHLGEKGKWSKHGSLWEIGTRVPLMIFAPGVSANGRTSPRVVEVLSIYPTLVELCGLPRVDGLEGDSIVPLLRNPTAPYDRPALSVAGGASRLGRAVRTERWRYVDWENGKAGAMLLDLQNDPDERINLIDDPRHADVVAQMRRLLERLPPVWKKS